MTGEEKLNVVAVYELEKLPLGITVWATTVPDEFAP